MCLFVGGEHELRIFDDKMGGGFKIKKKINDVICGRTLSSTNFTNSATNRQYYTGTESKIFSLKINGSDPDAKMGVCVFYCMTDLCNKSIMLESDFKIVLGVLFIFYNFYEINGSGV